MSIHSGLPTPPFTPSHTDKVDVTQDSPGVDNVNHVGPPDTATTDFPRQHLQEKNTTNGHISQPHRRVVSDGHLTQDDNKQKKRSSRYSAGHLLGSLVNITQKKRKPDTTDSTGLRSQAQEDNGNGSTLPGKQSPSSTSDSLHGRPASTNAGPSSDNTSAHASTNDDPDGHIQPFRKDKGKGRVSLGIDERTTWSMSSPRTSLGPNGSSEGHRQQEPRSVQSSQLDANALIQMALSLSQSRRLNLAPGQLASVGDSASRRVVSAGSPLPPGSLPRTSGQYPRFYGSSSTASPRVSADVASSFSSAAQDGVAQVVYTFSAATLARAEKARTFFELGSQYRSLLQHLPPLKPRAQLSEEQSLGRPYNPLQCIRNKQIRAKERQLIDVDAAGWGNADRVNLWMDTLDVDTQQAEYWSGDVARIPRWTQPNRRRASSAASTTLSDGLSTDAKKMTWTKIDWSTSPAELLADAYWTEQSLHKTLMEDRDGRKIFETFEHPHMTAIMEDQWLPDTSITESPRSRKDSVTQSFRHRRSSSARSTIDDVNDMGSTGFSPLAQHGKRRAQRGLNILRRRRGKSNEFSDSEESGDDSALRLGQKGSPKYDNTGPLGRQMQKMIELEARNKHLDTVHEISPIMHSDEYRGRMTGETDDDVGMKGRIKDTSAKHQQDSRDHSTPRISISDFETSARPSLDIRTDSIGTDDITAPPAKKHRRGSLLNFFHKHDPQNRDNKIEATDFALKDPNRLSPVKSFRRSFDISRTSSYKSLALQHTRSRSGDETTSTVGSFFKSGRLGDIVRNEKPRAGDFLKRGTEQAEVFDSDSDDDGHFSGLSLDRRKSRSTNDIRKEYYHFMELPTFKSMRLQERKSKDSDMAADDPIGRQSQALRDQIKSSRFEDNPLAVQIQEDDVSPSTSQLDLTKLNAPQIRGRAMARQGSRLAPDRDDSSSRSPGMKAGRRVDVVMRGAGAPGAEAGLPPTALGRLQAESRHQLISSTEKSTAITSRDIAHLQSILLVTGIKASTINRRSNTVRSPIPQYLQRAAKLSKASIAPVTRRQEHVLAANLLSHTLEESLALLTEDAQTFRNTTCNDLQSRMDNLRELLTAKLMPAVRTAGDEADTFIAQLTTTHTLSIKQVNDSVDLLMRNRRRRLRFLRNVGFKGLEWCVVGLLWIVWLVVSVLRVVRVVVSGTGRAARWAFWSS